MILNPHPHPARIHRLPESREHALFREFIILHARFGTCGSNFFAGPRLKTSRAAAAGDGGPLLSAIVKELDLDLVCAASCSDIPQLKVPLHWLHLRLLRFFFVFFC